MVSLNVSVIDFGERGGLIRGGSVMEFGERRGLIVESLMMAFGKRGGLIINRVYDDEVWGSEVV